MHVDPFPRDPFQDSVRRRGSRDRGVNREQPAVSETFASTKPYPSWWSNLDDSRVLRRRKSIGDVVLERNICFADTHWRGKDSSEQTNCIIHYSIQQLSRACHALHTVSNDLEGMMGGNGGSQVDVVLYLISQGMFLVNTFRY